MACEIIEANILLIRWSLRLYLSQIRSQINGEKKSNSIEIRAAEHYVILLTVCFSRTNFTAFSWQLDWFIARWLRTFVFYVSALDTRNNSSSFRHLCKREEKEKK